MSKICIRCIQPVEKCQCLENGETSLYFYKGSALKKTSSVRVVLAKQKLTTGFEMPPGTSHWFKGKEVVDSIDESKSLITVPNWELNDLIHEV